MGSNKEITIDNLERFARMSYPEDMLAQTKSVFIGLLKMDTQVAVEYMGEARQIENFPDAKFLQFADLDSREDRTALYKLSEKMAVELHDIWRQERDPDGSIAARIKRLYPENIEVSKELDN